MLTCAAGVLAGCESTTSGPDNKITTGPSARTLFVVNEGNFGKSNSSLDAILFRNQNSKLDTIINHGVASGLGLGNDILVVGNKVIVLDNGSNTIDILDADSLRMISSISLGLDKPNKMALISNDTLLVTRRGRTSAALIDLKSAKLVDSIPLAAMSYAVAVLNGKAYITTGAKSYDGPWDVTVVDLKSRTITNTFFATGSPEQAFADSTHNTVVIGMNPDYDKVSPKFYFISANDVITDSITVGTPFDLPQIVSGKPEYLILQKDIYDFTVADHNLSAPLYHSDSALYNGYYDAKGQDIYVGRYEFVNGGGKVDVIHVPAKSLSWSFSTGIAPAHFAFYH